MKIRCCKVMDQSISRRECRDASYWLLEEDGNL